MRTFITIDEASNLTDGQLKASTIRVYASPQQKTFTMYRVGAKEFVDKDEFLTDLTNYRASHKCSRYASKKEKAEKGASDNPFDPKLDAPDQTCISGMSEDYPPEAQVANLQRLLIAAWQKISVLKTELLILQKPPEKRIC